MMANNYESLKTDGHYTLARRIFQKIKNKYLTYVNYSPIVRSNEIVGIGFTETNDSGITQYFVLGKGDNVTFTQVGTSSTFNISADDTKVIQTEDTSTNANYEILSSGTGDNTTRTEGSHKSANLTYNPSSSKLTVKDNNGQVGFSVNNRAASRSMTVTESDVTMSGNQYWDGENQSLKTAVNGKVKKTISNGSTSVTSYFSSPYTLLSALPFGDSSLRLDDGTLFVHKDEQIESTAMVLYNNGINCYLLSVDGEMGEVTNVTGIGSWMLNQVGLSVMDIWRNGDSGWVGSDHSLANVLTSLNTSLQTRYFQAANVNFFVLSDMVFFQTWSTGLSLGARTWTNICQVPSGVPLPISDEGAINIPIVGGDQRQYSGVIRILKTNRQVAAFGSHSSGTQKYWGRSFYFTHL